MPVTVLPGITQQRIPLAIAPSGEGKGNPGLQQTYIEYQVMAHSLHRLLLAHLTLNVACRLKATLHKRLALRPDATRDQALDRLRRHPLTDSFLNRRQQLEILTPQPLIALFIESGDNQFLF